MLPNKSVYSTLLNWWSSFGEISAKIILHDKALRWLSVSSPQSILHGGVFQWRVWKLSLNSFTELHLRLKSNCTISLVRYPCGRLSPEYSICFTLMWASIFSLNINFKKIFPHCLLQLTFISKHIWFRYLLFIHMWVYFVKILFH